MLGFEVIMAFHAVFRHADDFGTQLLKIIQGVAETLCLGRTAGCVILGVEIQNDFRPLHILERQAALAIRDTFKCGRLGAGFNSAGFNSHVFVLLDCIHSIARRIADIAPIKNGGLAWPPN